MRTNISDLAKLSLDVYNGKVQNYSKADGENAIRKAILDAVGGEWSPYAFEANKQKVFAIMAEVLSEPLQAIFIDQFNGFADFKNVELGENNVFIINNNDLFKVATISDGNTDIRRQTIGQRKLTVSTEKIAVKIYVELDLFLAGRVDWADMITRVAKSFQVEIGTRIYNTIYNSYSSLTSPYAISGAFSETNLADLVAHVQAKTGASNVVIYGTKKALAKITNLNLSDSMKDQLNMTGYLGTFQGTPCLALPQSHTSGTDTFAVNDSFLLVLPADEKIVKFVYEGKPYVYDTPIGARNDEQLEYFYSIKCGVSAMIATYYGIYRLA